MDSTSTIRVLETVGDIINVMGGATVVLLGFIFILVSIELIKRNKKWDGEQ